MLRTILLILVFSQVAVAEQRSWGTADAVAGQRMNGWIAVPDGADGRDVRLPVTVIRGTAPGPTVGILAGIHGAEYVPIIAMHSLASRIEPTTVRGTIVIVLIANPPAFQRRTVFYGPNDWKNLNRVFPGRADGSQSERIAYVLTAQIIDRVEALIDVHCGDTNEELTPYVSFFADAPAADVTARSRAMALAFGIPVIKVSRDPARDPRATIYTTNTAVTHGVAGIAVEIGGLGRVDHDEVESVQTGIVSVLRQLGVLPGTASPAAKPLFMIDSRNVTSTADGIWFSAVGAGQPIAKDALIGTIRDPFGATLAEIHSPLTGYVVYVTRTPPTSKGEILASVGVLSESDASAPQGR